MSKLSAEDVLKLARLSRLRLSDAEVEQFRGEISEILNYVQMLDAVDTKGLEPTYQVTGLTNRTRSDTVAKDGPYALGQSELLKNAPATEDGQFKVRRVL